MKNGYEIKKEIPLIRDRAETLAAWYLRFNGYFTLENFILHDAGLQKQPGGQLSEIDLLAVRHAYTSEIIKDKKDSKIEIRPHSRLKVRDGITDFIIAEVKSKQCGFNWLDAQGKNKSVNIDYLKYALKRFGWWNNQDIDQFSEALSVHKRFPHKANNEDQTTKDYNHFRIRLFSIGVSACEDLAGIELLLFCEILNFLKNELFCSYGQTDKGKKIISDHKQWHPLIRQIYKRLWDKSSENSVDDVLIWLFPDSDKTNYI